MNKKIITIVILAAMLATTVPAFAQSVPTSADVPAGGDVNPPVITAKYEFLYDVAAAMDDDPVKPFLQVNPPTGFNTTKNIFYVAIATDLDGYDDLSSAYVDVYHPDGSFKYQLSLPHVVSCTDSPEQLTTFIQQIRDADAAKLITYDANYNLDKVIAELQQCSAKFFWGQENINSCQMCGQFTWESHCEGTNPCVTVWTPTDKKYGYEVRAYAFERAGGQSVKLVNKFEYMCKAGLETDFNKLDFQSVLYRVHKWIEGDRLWDTLGPACKSGVYSQFGTCVPPTIRNIGNTPVNIAITQDDMGFGQSNDGWNVQWDARLGEFNEYATSIFDPQQKVTLDGVLGLCGQNKISFSIFVKKPAITGTHSGNVLIEPVVVAYPWFTPAG